MNKPLSPAEAAKGHNRPPVLTPDEISRDFAYLETALADIERLFTGCPPVCEDNEDLETMRAAVRRFAGAYKRLETVRVEAKEPFLAATRIVDGYFNPLKTKVANWQSEIEGRAHRYLKKVEAEERAIREETARVAAVEAQKAAEEARLAEQRRIEAEQSNLAEVLAGEAPLADAGDASAARVEETTLRTVAIQKSADALKAQEAAVAKPADLARTRTGTGLSTLQTVFDFEILDPAALKPEELWEFIPAAEVEKAIRRCVALHKDQRKLSGVRIFPDTQIRMT